MSDYLNDKGRNSDDREQTCWKCFGHGFIMEMHLHGAPALHAPTPSGHVPCPICLGAGKLLRP